MWIVLFSKFFISTTLIFFYGEASDIQNGNNNVRLIITLSPILKVSFFTFLKFVFILQIYNKLIFSASSLPDCSGSTVFNLRPTMKIYAAVNT